MPAINPLPTPPSRNDPANFSDRADAFLAALPAYTSEANALLDDVHTSRDTVQGLRNEVIAAGLENAAANAATAATKAAEAASSASEAFGYLQTYRATSYGALANDPVVDPNGNPPTVGDEYFNTSMNLLKRFSGVTWQASDIATANLAAPGGSALIGYDDGAAQDVLDDAKPMANYTALRAYSGRATGVRITQTGLAGFFQRDDADTASADNGGTIIVDASGRRWKRSFDFDVDVEWFGAGDGVDDTSSFIAAMSYIQSQGPFNELASPNNWPSTKRFTLVGTKKTYLFSDQIISPDNARPNYVNFDISFPGSVFKALPSYDHTKSLIHMKAAFDYKIEGIGFVGFKTSDVIFNDSSLTQNYGGKCVYRDLRFANCDYGIRHELESVVAVFDQCMTDETIKRFLKVWRADQVVIRDGFFNWSQLSKSDYDGFIEFGKDEYTPTGEAAFPGGGTYNVARLHVENCMLIPTGSPGSPVKTAWIDLVSGSVTVRGCHFGPESPNRPITVLSRAVGATYQNVADQADSTVTIEDSSCASSFDVVHCYNDYPNYIHLRNIRLNVLDYSNSGVQRYLIGGNAATINTKTSKYNAAVSEFFRFDIGSTMPQNSNIIAIDPALIFARTVTSHPELCIGDTTNTAATPGTLARFDIHDRDYLAPSFAHTGGIYEVAITGEILSAPAGNTLYRVSYKGLIELAVEGQNLKVGYVQQYTSAVTGLGATPTIYAVFLNGGTNGESTSEPIATLNSGNFWLRINAVTNLSGNNWQGLVCRLRRII